YSLGSVFGEKLKSMLIRCLPGHTDLIYIITNFTLRRWFPSVIWDLRVSRNQNLRLDEANVMLRSCYGKNFRYWLFIWPMLKLPLPVAKFWLKITTLMSKILYISSMPDFWKKEI
ncbi:MAG TPA: hypothetical protein VFE38_15650, partial [Edaphobacter sp.]|nr:hypothetical protein [Edaphobacter sp.]